jgi:hypothetical protein
MHRLPVRLLQVRTLVGCDWKRIRVPHSHRRRVGWPCAILPRTLQAGCCCRCCCERVAANGPDVPSLVPGFTCRPSAASAGALTLRVSCRLQVATNNEVVRIADCYEDPRWQGQEMDKKTSANPDALCHQPSSYTVPLPQPAKRSAHRACVRIGSLTCLCCPSDFKTRNMLVYPICAPGEAEKPVGVLQMINKIGGAFDSADEERLAAFSKKAAAVISANPMYYKHEEEHETEASALSGALSSPKVRRLVLPCVPPCLLLALGPRPT